MEVRPYNPQSKKHDPETISGYFISYCEGSRGSRFYCPSHTTKVIELDRAIYFEGGIGTQDKGQEKLYSKNTQFLFL